MISHRLSIERAAALRSNALSFDKMLDRVQVGAVRRQVEQRGSARFNSFADAGDLVDANVVHDDDVTVFEGRSEDVFDLGQEACAIHRTIQQDRRSDGIATECGDKGRSLPMTMRHLTDQPLATRLPTVAAAHRTKSQIGDPHVRFRRNRYQSTLATPSRLSCRRFTHDGRKESPGRDTGKMVQYDLNAL
jgi:hypothetical protein